MVLGQTLKAACSCETLRHHDTDDDCYLVLLSRRPSVDVLQKSRESGFLQRLLKILVSEDHGPTGKLASQTSDLGGSMLTF